MKKLTNLKDVKTLNKKEQKGVYGGRSSGSGACQVGCAGLSNGDACFASGSSPNCGCLGICGSSGGDV